MRKRRYFISKKTYNLFYNLKTVKHSTTPSLLCYFSILNSRGKKFNKRRVIIISLSQFPRAAAVADKASRELIYKFFKTSRRHTSRLTDSFHEGISINYHTLAYVLRTWWDRQTIFISLEEILWRGRKTCLFVKV